MFRLLLVNFLINSVYGGKIIQDCTDLTSKDICIKSPFCAWCNKTSFSLYENNTFENSNINYTCIYQNTCLDDESYDCTYNDNYLRLCASINFAVNFTIIFVYLISIIFIIEFTDRVLKKYYMEDRDISNIQCLVLSLLFIPGLFLLATGNIVLIYYIIFIICLSLFLCCCTNTTKYIEHKKNTNNDYTRINTNEQ